MDRRAIAELCIPEYEILDEVAIGKKKDKSGLRVKVKWQEVDTININHRKYPKELLAREIARLAPKLENGEIIGAAYHPEDGIGETVDTSHKWDKVEIEDDGSCTGELTVLPTSKGSDIITQLQAGVKLGMSSRGFGTVTERTEKIDGKEIKYDEVNDDYRLQSFGDWVINPGVEGAGFIKMVESQMNKFADSETKNKEVKNVKKIETVEGLREEYPELTQEIETEAKKGLSTEDQVAEKVKTAEEAKDTDFEAKLETAVNEAKEQGKEEGKIEAYRDIISTAADKDGVVPDLTGDPNADPNVDPPAKDEKELKELQKKLDESEKAKAKLEKEKTDREAKDAEVKLQVEMKTELDKILEKEEYKAYKPLIEKRLFVDGKVKAESVEKVEEAVKSIHKEISSIIAETKKSEITLNIEERGHISDPEGDAKKAALETTKKLYSEAKNSGYSETYETYMKEEYPKTHKQE